LQGAAKSLPQQGLQILEFKDNSNWCNHTQPHLVSSFPGQPCSQALQTLLWWLNEDY